MLMPLVITLIRMFSNFAFINNTRCIKVLSAEMFMAISSSG